MVHFWDDSQGRRNHLKEEWIRNVEGGHQLWGLGSDPISAYSWAHWDWLRSCFATSKMQQNISCDSCCMKPCNVKNPCQLKKDSYIYNNNKIVFLHDHLRIRCVWMAPIHQSPPTIFQPHLILIALPGSKWGWRILQGMFAVSYQQGPLVDRI